MTVDKAEPGAKVLNTGSDAYGTSFGPINAVSCYCCFKFLLPSATVCASLLLAPPQPKAINGQDNRLPHLDLVPKSAGILEVEFFLCLHRSVLVVLPHSSAHGVHAVQYVMDGAVPSNVTDS